MAFKMSEQAQTIQVYNLRSDTNEFIGAGDAYIPPHTGLPANYTDIAPPDITGSHTAVFDTEKNVELVRGPPWRNSVRYDNR